VGKSEAKEVEYYYERSERSRIFIRRNKSGSGNNDQIDIFCSSDTFYISSTSTKALASSSSLRC
jgi:hypothetical protein